MFDLESIVTSALGVRQKMGGYDVSVHITALPAAVKKLEKYLPLYAEELGLKPEDFELVLVPIKSAEDSCVRLGRPRHQLRLRAEEFLVDKSVLFHELVHVKQITSDGSAFSEDLKTWTYKGVTITPEDLRDTAKGGRYWDLPSEVEAYRMQFTKMNPVWWAINKIIYRVISGKWM